MTRSRSEIRVGLRAVFEQRGHATWREVLPAVPGVNPRSPGEVLLVRRTVENMVRTGELVKVGSSREAGSRIYRALYELAEPQPEAPAEIPAPTVRLSDAMWNFMSCGKGKG